MHYLSVLAIFKNETMNLKLWLDHYLWQGVDHFYLIDNGSTDDPLSILQEYIDQGTVTYTYRPERFQQRHLYQQVYDNEKLQENTQWCCVCDLDEFFYGTNNNTTVNLRDIASTATDDVVRPLANVLLRDVLQSMESETDVILSNWVMFGHENLVEHPKDIRTAIVHREVELNGNTKCIFKTKGVTSSMVHIHSLENYQGPVKVENERIHLNHYVLQSLEFFQNVKMTRGAADCPQHENVRTMSYFHRYNVNCTLLDEQLKLQVENRG